MEKLEQDEDSETIENTEEEVMQSVDPSQTKLASGTNQIKLSTLVDMSPHSALFQSRKALDLDGSPEELRVALDIVVPGVPVLICEGGSPGLGNKAFSGSHTKRSRSVVGDLVKFSFVTNFFV
jgi:hypothetical protein